jgi:hypothetical protein
MSTGENTSTTSVLILFTRMGARAGIVERLTTAPDQRHPHA